MQKDRPLILLVHRNQNLYVVQMETHTVIQQLSELQHVWTLIWKRNTMVGAPVTKMILKVFQIFFGIYNVILWWVKKLINKKHFKITNLQILYLWQIVPIFLRPKYEPYQFQKGIEIDYPPHIYRVSIIWYLRTSLSFCDGCFVLHRVVAQLEKRYDILMNRIEV